jgi:hypothetical protein
VTTYRDYSLISSGQQLHHEKHRVNKSVDSRSFDLELRRKTANGRRETANTKLRHLTIFVCILKDLFKSSEKILGHDINILFETIFCIKYSKGK